jgi:hypothetical protein
MASEPVCLVQSLVSAIAEDGLSKTVLMGAKKLAIAPMVKGSKYCFIMFSLDV